MYILSFSVIMLQTDAHKGAIKKKMTCEQFVHNNRGIDQGRNLPRDFLETLYDNIVNHPIAMEDGGDIAASFSMGAEKKGYLVKQGGRRKNWKKRWFVLRDNCLYYFLREDDQQPRGIVPLENVSPFPFFW